MGKCLCDTNESIVNDLVKLHNVKEGDKATVLVILGNGVIQLIAQHN